MIPSLCFELHNCVEEAGGQNGGQDGGQESCKDGFFVVVFLKYTQQFNKQQHNMFERDAFCQKIFFKKIKISLKKTVKNKKLHSTPTLFLHPQAAGLFVENFDNQPFVCHHLLHFLNL